MKVWYRSRTLWLNILSAIAMFIQTQYHFVLPASLEAEILMILNIALRFDTSTAITLDSAPVASPDIVPAPAV